MIGLYEMFVWKCFLVDVMMVLLLLMMMMVLMMRTCLVDGMGHNEIEPALSQ